ncbi:hypothetical protein K3553_19655 (plasmid) [Leisingera aquaemixtae]|uniref:Uncharacterized protein n=1 Tax=Leisingera aquaemixtae TaxID=1396826 RepID=A0ABY5WQ10_9RHOB|nr:hypothetical protein [Leisingera aquaemixtae]UWQ27121.1 hypothetical protein K3553_19655 [Leisingera aquaemixtae]UWQ39760.1 hypothetical protein K3552_20250 [Leisingera aquaemixtae]UWQ43507.1 hypothetical protein K3718_19275 [Leisingera aquaemixtae]
MEWTNEKAHQAGERGRDVSRRELELLRKASEASGRSLGFWSDLTEGLDQRSIALLVSRAHMVSPDGSAVPDTLAQDQREVLAMLSQVGHRDRGVFLRALRGLIDLRKGRLN